MKRKSLAAAAAAVTLILAGTAAAESGVLHLRLGAASGQPTATGITVHGRWNIVVRNQNGKVVTRRRFENKLVGQDLLAALFTRQTTVGYWVIVLSGNACTGSDCYLAEKAMNAGFSNGPVSISEVNGQQLVLQGTFTATADGAVNEVATQNYACAPTVAPATSCPSGASGVTGYTFTDKKLPNPIDVQSGQSIAVTVNLSFS